MTTTDAGAWPVGHCVCGGDGYCRCDETAPDSATTYDLLAYERGNDANEVTRRGLPGWRLGYAVQWALTAGRNTLLIEADVSPRTVFGEREGAMIAHHICRDPGCPGGCFDERDG